MNVRKFAATLAVAVVAVVAGAQAPAMAWDGYLLQDSAHERCITAPNGNNNTRATSEPCNWNTATNANQRWEMEFVDGPQVVALRSVAFPNICLTVPHWANYDAALYSCGYYGDQIFNRTYPGGGEMFQAQSSGRCLVNAHWDSNFLSSYTCSTSYTDMKYYVHS